VLALGSGGAKGFAHLGALRAFEDNGIEIDLVAGTSIGSIIGAFYCDGYTSVDILELLSRVDFSEIVNPVIVRMDTIGLFKVIDREIGSLQIQELKKPFRAVATEIESGNEKVFSSGSVASALCASCCMPPFFRPVVIDGKRYVDGAYTNSIPADVVRELGADYVIGIDLKTESRINALKKIIPTYKSSVKEPWKKGYDNSDVMLHPDLNGYTSLSFGSSRQIYDIGYQLAIENIPKIKSDLDRLKKGKKL
jgi:NTE family protein